MRATGIGRVDHQLPMNDISTLGWLGAIPASMTPIGPPPVALRFARDRPGHYGDASAIGAARPYRTKQIGRGASTESVRAPR